MASDTDEPPVGTLDPQLLNRFIAELEDAGFTPNKLGREWTGPLPTALQSLTSATVMTVVLNDGWPYQPPAIKVEGIRSWHANLGWVCLWQRGDNSRGWTTIDGIHRRIAEWSRDALNDFQHRGHALDPHLYWETQHTAVALLDIQAMLHRTRQDGHHGIFHARRLQKHVWELGRDKGYGPEVINGRYFYRPSIPCPPRDIDELAEVLTATQRRRLRKDLDDLLPGREWIAALFWEVDEGTVPLILHASRRADGHLSVAAVAPEPIGQEDLKRRAGPDISLLQQRRVVVFGVGAIGSHVASLLARSGVGGMRLIDADRIWPAGLIRHAADPRRVSDTKPDAMRATLAHLPWVGIEPVAENGWNPDRLAQLMEGAHLVVECTGDGGFTELVARVAARSGRHLVSVALYRGGAVVRARRQAAGDTPIAERSGHWRYRTIPAGNDEDEFVGYEAGCAAPINNAPPVAVVRAAGLAASMCVDDLLGRHEYPDEIIEVYRPIEPPFDRPGPVAVPDVPPRVDVTESAAGFMRLAARRAAPNETGGLLVGRVVQGVPLITTAVELQSSQPTPTTYQVEAGATTRAVEDAVADDPGSGYVGEWHSHPSDQPASQTDRDTMTALAAADGTGHPVLIVVRPRDNGFALDAYLASTDALQPVDVRIVGTPIIPEHEEH